MIKNYVTTHQKNYIKQFHYHFYQLFFFDSQNKVPKESLGLI